MSYATQAMMFRDPYLRDRIAACYATQPGSDNPTWWAEQNQWKLAASPGWDDTYAYAINNEVVDPGNQDAVITDQMILSAVQALLNGDA